MNVAGLPGPADDEIEVSLFGPGKGESCVVHLGDGDWMIVDSCTSQRRGGNSALVYLQGLGVDVGSQVKLIVATHAHDDHISGLADIVEACGSAEVVLPAAASLEEFFTLLEVDEHAEEYLRVSAYSQYRRVFDILERRAVGTLPGFTRAIADRVLWRRNIGLRAEVHALAPSDEAVTQSLDEFAELLQLDGRPRGQVSNKDPNTFSVALWVVVGDDRILLGGDLYSGPGPDCGWNAIVTSTTRPPGRASVYKVAHHGSKTSHHPGIWNDLLDPDPVAILAPFRGSKSPPPTPADEHVLRGHSSRVFLTASSSASQPSSVRRVAANLGHVATNVREVGGIPGHIRARKTPLETEWSVELVRPARAL